MYDENIIEELEAPKEFLDIIQASLDQFIDNVDANNNDSSALNQNENKEKSTVANFEPTPQKSLKRKSNDSPFSDENSIKSLSSSHKKPKREPVI